MASFAASLAYFKHGGGKHKRAAVKFAALAFIFAILNVVADTVVSFFDSGSASARHGLQHSYNNIAGRQVGYFNLSCPFEMSKYSCAYMQHGPKAEEVVRRSTEYYLSNTNAIQSAFDRAIREGSNRRVLFTGDSLMRQVFIGMACNAASLGENLIEHAEIPWKDEWPCHGNAPCFITGGEHGGFDGASIRLINGMEIHFVPHMGFKDDATAETDIIDRLARDVQTYGRITFGDKTAMSPGGPKVDVLVYNVGIHYGQGRARKNINHFANWIVKPLMEQERNVTDGRSGLSRPKTIYVTTPTQHFNTPTGQWVQGMTKESKQCVDRIRSNPRAELEKELLAPGVNVDALLEYDDLELGAMHVRKNKDCSHYCMPGVPDLVAARLVEELLV